MSEVLRSTGWSALLIVLLPLLIIGVGEIEERLRQQDSRLRRPVAISRTWVLPLFVAWFVVRAVFGLDDDNPLVLLLASALVLALSAAVLTAMQVVVDRLAATPRRGGRAPLPRLLLALPRLGVLLVASWLLLSVVWNIDLSAALTALGVTSLVVSFALQDPLSSLASGFLLLADEPFQPGDWIQFDETEGRVTDVNWRTTRIETRDGDMVTVPNGTLAAANVINHDQPSRLHRVVVPVQVAYSNSPTSAKEMLVAAARATPGVLEEPPPVALVVQVDDPLMGYDVHMWIDDYTRAPGVASDFGSLVWYHSHRRDVPLPSPAFDLFHHDAAEAAASDQPPRSDLLAALRQSPVLDQLDPDTTDRLADAAMLRRYARGEVIIAAGDVADLRLLDGGHAALVLRADEGDATVADYGPGELLGLADHPIVDGMVPVVVAVDDCDVLVIAADVAGTVISLTPSLSGALDQLRASRKRRLRHVRRRLAEHRVEDPTPAEGTSSTPGRAAPPPEVDAPGAVEHDREVG